MLVLVLVLVLRLVLRLVLVVRRPWGCGIKVVVVRHTASAGVPRAGRCMRCIRCTWFNATHHTRAGVVVPTCTTTVTTAAVAAAAVTATAIATAAIATAATVTTATVTTTAATPKQLPHSNITDGIRGHQTRG